MKDASSKIDAQKKGSSTDNADGEEKVPISENQCNLVNILYIHGVIYNNTLFIS